ncbi:MAG: amidohydrolase family protein [Kiloniellaceae bacterium]
MASPQAAPAAPRPKLVAPTGACDTHMHFYNGKYPTAPSALIMPPDAWIDDYRKVQARLGLERVVVVQPTTYGTDNACQLEAMAAFGADARGVVVVDASASEAEIARLTRHGVRGARFQMLPGGAVPWDILEEVAARVHGFGWHIQLQMNGREFAERAALLRRLPGTLVVDHVGRFMDPVPPDHPSFKVLLDLLDAGRCWVKLSAPYESSKDGPPRYADVAAEAKVLAAHAPERMLWASNWPHPGRTPPPDDAAMLDLLLDWVEDEAARTRILADNPAELYGF